MKNKTVAALLAFFLGGIGGHKFYLGQPGRGLLYLVFCWTFIPAVVAFVEFLILLTMDERAFDQRYNAAYLPGYAPAPALPQNIVVNVQNTAAASGAGAAAHSTADIATQLKSLHELKVAGALTEEEFAEQKRRLLTSGTR